MAALGVHHTATTDEAWDGPANEARLRLDESESYYRQAYAWQDPDGDPETKASYKFIHHMVGEDGRVGAANVRACQTGIGVLNGARGGTTIPSGDRRGVWNHLAAHLRDADMEPPDLRSHIHSGQERRSFPLQEIRLAGDGDLRRIEGHAALFNVLSVPMFGFRERIANGAFRKTIQEADVRALWNHNVDYVLGRRKAGTLRLAEDDSGLGFQIFPPATQWARDFMVSIERGDVDQMSFSFNAVRESWTTEGGETVRTLEEVALSDISPVTFPAYPQTYVQLRSVFGLELRGIQEAMQRLEAGRMTDADEELLRGLIDRVNERLTAGPTGAGHPAGDGADQERVRARLARMRRRIELAEV